jgi:hypothetical protein
MNKISSFSAAFPKLGFANPSVAMTLPRGNVKDVESFLTIIGKNAINSASKIASWDVLMNSSSKQLKTLGVDCKTRKHVRKWVDLYKMGIDPWEFAQHIKGQRGPKWRY